MTHTIHQTDWGDQIRRDGFAVVRDVLNGAAVSALRAALDQADWSRRRSAGYAIRNLLEQVPAVARLAEDDAIVNLIQPVLGSRAAAVRGILFDKSHDANWHVGWHQDRAIAVRERLDAPGFGPWSVKAGVSHVEPPTRVLERMLTVRLHLDDCDVDNGALRVLPGTHRLGKLDDHERGRVIEAHHAQVCEARAGDALLMRPLLMHASSPNRSGRRRRVVHIEYAAESLPSGLTWHAENTARRDPCPT